MVEDKKTGVGPSAFGRRLVSGSALPPWSRCWPALCGYNYNFNYNHKMTIFRGSRKKEDRVAPSGWGRPFGLGLALPFRFFSWPFHLLGWGWPLGSGLALLSWVFGWPTFCGNNYKYK